MSKELVHQITKIIVNEKSSRFLCDECNTSYPTFKSVKEDHPNITIDEISEYRKNKIGVYSNGN